MAQTLEKRISKDQNVLENGVKYPQDKPDGAVVIDNVEATAATNDESTRTISSKAHEESRTLLSPADQDSQSKKDLAVEIEMHSLLPKPLPCDDDNWTDSEDEEDDVDVNDGNIISKVVVTSRRGLSLVVTSVMEKTNGYLIQFVLLLAYIAYLVASLLHRFDDEGAYRLLGFSLLGALIKTRRIIYSSSVWLVRKATGIEKISSQCQKRVDVVRFFSRWLFYGAIAGVMAWILIDKAISEPQNLRSLPGLIIIMLVCLMCSTKPHKINYHTVFWGVGLQFILSLLVLNWKSGKDAIVWVQSRLDEFFENSAAGSKFLFGDSYEDHYISFGALPLLFFTNGILTLLYYLGVMQFIIKVIGDFLTFVLETTGIESMAVAAGIFMEGVTSLSAFRPYLGTLSKSQMFVVLTSCLSSLGGAYLAVLSKMGVSVEFIIGAMLVSAPATFTVCKLMVPESRDIKKEQDAIVSKIGDTERGKYSSAMDAMQTGALSMLPVVGDIAVSIFTLICFIDWLNSTLMWFGDRIGVSGLTMEFIASYLLYPFSLVMGIELQDCRRVAMLNGYRVASSNIVAFFKLTEMQENRMKFEEYMLKTNWTGNVTYINDDVILEDWGQTLPLGFISLRSEAITTYFLCGFSSFLSVAIHLGILAAFVPQRKTWFQRVAPAAFIAGNLANIMTGCFACIFYTS